MMCTVTVIRRVFWVWMCCVGISMLAPVAVAYGAETESRTVASPNGKIAIGIGTDTASQLTWSVQRQDHTVLAPAPLGLTVDDHNLGQSVTLGEPRTRTIDEQYSIWGNHAVAVNRCNEAVIPVTCADGMKYELEVRAFDDGAAVRYRVELDDVPHAIASETTSFALPPDARAWWAHYDSGYERPCKSGLASGIPENAPLSPPITFGLGGNLYVSLTEANNDCFPDMGLERDGAFFKTVFPALSNGWSHQGSIVTPWRVAIIAEGLNALVNSDIVTNLCPPPPADLANADWIKPGRSLWHWWSTGAPKLDCQKEWIDAAKKLGFEYYLIDEGWRNWRVPDKDQWECLKEVIDYAKTQSVGSLVWVNSSEMRTDANRRAYLEKVATLGAVGIKIDFIPACTAEITRWYEGALKDTADLHLLCNFHGAVKPTGRRRTWPHEFTREAVRGHEYHMTRYRRIQAADHDETVLFTRFLAGPADYTPTAFDLREMVGYTWAHLLAQAVDMTSPLQHFAGKYQDFIGNPAEDLLRHLPSTWDETIVLPGSEIGKTVGFARRRGREWYIGVLNGGETATLPIDLSFLGPGDWQAEVFGDDPDNPATFKCESKAVTAGDKFTASMSPRGGTVVWITKAGSQQSGKPVGLDVNRIEQISLLGYNGKVDWEQTAEGLTVTLPEQKVSEYTAALKITGSALTNVPYAAPLPVQSAQKDATGVTIKLQSGLLRLEVCDDRTIHVTCSPTDKLPEKKEFVVTRQWTPVPFEWHEEQTQMVLRTTRMGVEVNRASGALTFVDAAGKTLLQEPPDGGRIITEAKPAADQERTYSVLQTFLLPDDERLYGMAQCQDGVWNWRGMPIELRQLNTQAALPVLVSSRGYGLLWDNASLTDFNPVDYEILLSSSSDTMSSTKPAATEQLRDGSRATSVSSQERIGTFTTGEAGEYVFFAKNGNRRNEIGIVVNGQIITHHRNMWVPYTAAGKISLPAGSTCSVRLLGGGRNARLFARPLGNTTTFRSQTADSIDYYFLYGPELDDVVAAYRNATGAAPLWPKWAYGFWQCRERYSNQQQILDTVAEFRKRQIPIDLIVQDWQYWGSHGWGAYEWDASHYPDPEKLIQSLHEQNVRFMISVWSNPQGKAGADLKSRNYVIPGTDWVDAFNPAARELRWQYLNDAFFKIGTDAWWQDATEPGDDGNSMANHRVYLGSGDLYRNAYPLFANQAVYEWQRKTSPEKRVCILTRSAYPGQQRYATALWSGDIAGNWEAFRRQIPAGLNVCLTGLPYWTTDCGGFFRPRDQYQSEDYADLLIRWFQFSTFCPVQRIHGYQSETEFWKFTQALETLVEYDHLRYRLLPYIYSVAWRVTHDGYTMMRALPMDFRADPNVYNICDQYMFGPAFLVSPVLQPKATTRSVYLPAPAAWTNFWTGATSPAGQRVEVAAPIETLPMFIRAGSIIPMGPYLQYSNEKPADPIELRIYPGKNGSFTLYEDEGDSYRYEKGVYATIDFSWDDASKTLTIGQRKGEFPGMLRERTFNVVLVKDNHGHGVAPVETPDQVVKYDGTEVKVKLNE